MIPRNERGIPARYINSPSTQARHQAKLFSMLDWIYRHGFTSPAVLMFLWGLDRSVVNKLLRRYEREEVIAEIATFACRDKRVFVLKPKGLRLLEDFHSEDLKYNMKKSTIPVRTLTHDLMAQAVVAINVNKGKCVFFITEREQEKDTLGKRRRFDAIIFNGSEFIAIEVEASAKQIPNRLDILRRYRTAIIEEQRVQTILLCSHSNRLLRDAERIHNKLFAKQENKLDKEFFNEHVKYVYNKETMSNLRQHFWLS